MIRMKRFVGAVALVLVSVGSVGNASAAAMFVDSFPTAGATRSTASGVNFWNDGDFIQELLTGTGLSEMTSLTLDLPIIDNVLSSDTQDMDVILNSITIGSFMVATGDSTLNLFFDGFSVAGAGLGGDDYTLRLETTRTVDGGAGSAGIGTGSGNLTLAQANRVSAPGSAILLLLGLGLGAIGSRQRRKLG